MSVREIAKKAKVSIATVDRVLHNRGRVSKKTQEKILKIIAELDYKPNIYARNLSLAKTFQFGILMPQLDQDSDYWRIPANGIGKAQRELAAYKVEIKNFFFDRYSEHSFEEAFRTALRENLDGLLIAPVLLHIAKTIIPDIPEQLPFVFFDSFIRRTNCICRITQDSHQSGVLAAQLMKFIIHDAGSLAIIKVLPEDLHINERLRGFHAAMKGFPQVQTKIYEADSGEGETGFEKLCARIAQENPDLLGIFVTNAWTYPVAKYFRAEGSDKKIHIIGYDLIEKNIAFLKENAIDFIISQRPEMQGYLGIYSLYRHVILKEPVAQNIMVPLDIVTRENLKYYQD